MKTSPLLPSSEHAYVLFVFIQIDATHEGGQSNSNLEMTISLSTLRIFMGLFFSLSLGMQKYYKIFLQTNVAFRLINV